MANGKKIKTFDNINTINFNFSTSNFNRKRFHTMINCIFNIKSCIFKSSVTTRDSISNSRNVTGVSNLIDSI